MKGWCRASHWNTQCLVAYAQTVDVGERRALRGNLGRLRRYQDVHALTEARDAYHHNWYLPAIRELSASKHFRPEPKWIARALSPNVSVRELLDEFDAGNSGVQVVQVNFQLFPLSERIDRELGAS